MNSRKHFVGRVVVATVSCATLKEPTARSQSDGRSTRGVGWPAPGVLYPGAHSGHRRTAFNCIAYGGLMPLVEKTWADLATGVRLFSILAVQRHDP